MGIDFAQVKFFDACHAKGGIYDPVLAMGSLKIQESQEEIERFARENNYGGLGETKSIKTLFLNRYGIKEYSDCDLNGLADFTLDLGRPLSKEYVGKFGAILNGGTLEHIFDLRQAFENFHIMVRPGGTMLHLVPVNWYNHGFVNFNPLLFELLAEANNYTILVEGFYFLTGIHLEDEGKSSVCLLRGGQEDQHVIQVVNQILRTNRLPANSMYLVALRKNHDAVFSSPYQVTL